MLGNSILGTRQIYNAYNEKQEDGRMQLVLALWFVGMQDLPMFIV